MWTPIIKELAILALLFCSLVSTADAAYLPKTLVKATAVPTATVAPVQTSEPTEPAAYSLIERGNSGPAVEALQQQLTLLGYYNGPITGKMDSATQLAYKKFEKANGFKQNGIASPEEQAVLYSEDAIPAK